MAVTDPLVVDTLVMGGYEKGLHTKGLSHLTMN